MSDAVNHPTHYNQGRIEVIDFLEDQKLELHEACAVKYVCRAMHKGDRVTDLRKAIWYLQRKVDLLVRERDAVRILKERYGFDDDVNAKKMDRYTEAHK